ncbi:SET domain-containing protein [Urbifossiella limnaea]|uniref:SET domain protein n=1 Tax=Urbifossiella limnaea TaxID=2528023 RepID=A0A517XNW8_9BACT|nr:SET domain-containing protein [Urbifossiella limnaea]QDU19176.1 SET domain protein [Urbifossiella limnaea]
MHLFRLKPSTIPGAGVGVFATVDIPAGTVLTELFADDDVRFVPWADFAVLPGPAEVRENFAVRYDDGAYLPRDLNRISVGWFLNDSRDPNLAHDADYVYFARRDIAAGEELLIDYDTL